MVLSSMDPQTAATGRRVCREWQGGLALRWKRLTFRYHIKLAGRVARYPAVTTVEFENCRMGRTGNLRALLLFPRLTSLRLVHPNLTEQGIEALGRLTRLTRLDISACGHYRCCLGLNLQGARGANRFAVLGELVNLTDLCISSPRLKDAVLAAALRPLTALTSLDLDGCDRITGAGLLGCLSGAALSGMRRIRLGRGVTDAGMAQVGHLTSLTELSLRRCDKLSVAGVEEMLHLTRLERLEMSESYEIMEDFPDEILTVLGPVLSRLTDLNMDLSAVSEPMIRTHLRPLTGLRKLILSNCRMSGALDDEPIYPNGLTALDLSDTSVTDEALRGLSPLTDLTSLNLEDCKAVTDGGMQWLRENLPQCKLYRGTGVDAR
jgi:Leucine-rich repeat (LRR) protein